MNNKDNNFDDSFSLFQDEVKGVKRWHQDTIIHKPNRNTKQKEIKRSLRDAKNNEFFFSDEFIPNLEREGPTRYAREGVSKYEVKRLRRGVYVPDTYLDMHGMTQQEAKGELGSVISYCIKENVHCVCIIHGIGKHILKQKVPIWLAQHPNVMAFHQAPQEFGGNGALLVLLEIPDE